MKATGIRVFFNPSQFLNRLKTTLNQTTGGCIPSYRLSSTVSKALATEEARRENWRRRVDLAACYRGLEKYGLHEGVCNHLSMMAPAANGEGEVMLLIPYGLHWSEVLTKYCFIGESLFTVFPH